jgi:hypothetical protein
MTITKVSNDMKPALTPEAKENQMIYLATSLAEKQLKDGTASSQVITHYLKLATEETRRKNKLLEMQTKLAAAKTESLESAKEIEELYKEAIKAMNHYKGLDEENELENGQQ